MPSTGLAPPIERLVSELSKLPTIGRKTAQRLAFHLLGAPAGDVQALARAIADLPDRIRACSTCFHLTEADPCALCSDPARDRSRVCVVEGPVNVVGLERTGAYRGLYHVLGGSLSPLRDVGPEDLHLAELVDRIDREGFEEIVIATNPNVEGEATAVYVARMIAGKKVRITRLAQGLPAGSDLEFADDVTLARAFEGRREF